MSLGDAAIGDTEVYDELEAADAGVALAGRAEAPTATPVMMAATANIRDQNLRMNFPPRRKPDAIQK